jgi:hypothetical protein
VKTKTGESAAGRVLRKSDQSTIWSGHQSVTIRLLAGWLLVADDDDEESCAPETRSRYTGRADKARFISL